MIPLARPRTLASVALALTAVACFASSNTPISAGQGPEPELPAPKTGLIPTVRVAEATGWGADGAPAAASGLRVRFVRLT